MIRLIHQFAKDTRGAVTIDWVVLTAAVVGLGIAATVEIINGTTEIGEGVGTFMETDPRFVQNR